MVYQLYMELQFDSEGDPRVHLVINIVLSALLVYILLWGLDLLGTLEFTLVRFALGTLILAAITHVLI